MTKKEPEKKHEIEKIPNETHIRHMADLSEDQILKFLGEPEYNEDHFVEIVSQGDVNAQIAHEVGLQHVIRTGLALFLMKEKTPHGKWGGVVERTNLSGRTARRYMLYAQRAKDMNILGSKILKLGLVKGMEILTLPEHELKRLEQGGGDITLDEFDRMSLEEVKKAARKYKRGKALDKEKIKNGEEQNANQKEIIDNMMKKRAMPSEIADLCTNVVPMLSMLIDMPLPKERWEAENVATFAKLIFSKSQDVYNKFAYLPGAKIIHKVPDMEALEKELGLEPGESAKPIEDDIPPG